MTDRRHEEKKALHFVAHAAMKRAMAEGATAVRARAAAARSTTIAYREGRPDKIEESSTRRLSLAVYVKGHFGSCETNAQPGPELDRFVDRAVALARAVKEDPHRRLPDQSLCAGGADVDLEILDQAIGEVTAEARHDYAAALEQELKTQGQGKDVVSAEGRYEEVERQLVQVDSNGFEGSHEETQYWAFAEASLEDQGKRPSGWGAAATRCWANREKPAIVAEQALAAAAHRLGARPIPSAQLPIIIENRATGRLVRYLLAALQGQSLHQRLSFLQDRLDEPIGSELLTLHDDPLLPRGLGSRRFDREGLTAKTRPIFEKGVLRSFYIDTYYGGKLNRPPTSGSSSNVTMPGGDKDLSELVADVDRGLLVRGFLGGNSNPATGDFSLGVYGTTIDKGQLGHAVSEVNIAGNHLVLWQHLTDVGNDGYQHSTVRLPSLRFDGVQVSGS